ncbi:MAG: pyruvate kinase [Chloroflexi bacterium]|nr:pyruvate kinase [Chloroflexota bacterium]
MRPDFFKRRTKIVCTIGPATQSAETIEALIRAGMDIARLNLSHGTLSQHARFISLVRSLGSRLDINHAILLDLPGPKYRIGRLAGGKATLRKGDEVTLTTRDIEGNAALLPVNIPTLPRDVRPGQHVLLDDGAIQLKVRGVAGSEVRARVTSGGELLPERGLAAPGAHISAPFMTDALRRGIAFAAEQRPDYLALSFVGSPDNVEQVRDMLKMKNCDIPIISKVEHREGVKNFDKILEVSDGIMVARGDLGVEIPLEEVPLVQKDIIKKCNRAGKPVITATEMLESMVQAARPTRAEATDVANAIFDGTDATMLSQETAIGRYPVQSVRVMARIAGAAEKRLPYERLLEERASWLEPQTDELIAYNACHTARILGAAAIVAFTRSGSTAHRLSKYRPLTPVLALTSSETVLRRLVLRWGVHAYLISERATVDELFATGATVARELGLAKKDDLIIITGGVPIGLSGSTNLLKVENIRD